MSHWVLSGNVNISMPALPRRALSPSPPATPPQRKEPCVPCCHFAYPKVLCALAVRAVQEPSPLAVQGAKDGGGRGERVVTAVLSPSWVGCLHSTGTRWRRGEEPQHSALGLSSLQSALPPVR